MQKISEMKEKNRNRGTKFLNGKDSSARKP